MQIASYRCNTYGCSNTAKAGYGRCTPCYQSYVDSSNDYDTSYSTPDFEWAAKLISFIRTYPGLSVGIFVAFLILSWVSK